MLRHQHSASSLKSSSTGAPRFSKALPSLPSPHEDAPHLPLKLLKDLPQLPPQLSPSPSPPPPLPLKDKDNANSKALKTWANISRKPVNAVVTQTGQPGRSTRPPKPLPSLQLLPPPPPSSLYPTPPSSSTASSSGDKSLPRLPRRAVGSGQAQYDMMQLPTPGRSSTSSSTYERGQSSPTDTLSSLLSAYSPEDEEMPLKISSTGGATKGSQLTVSPPVGTSTTWSRPTSEEGRRQPLQPRQSKQTPGRLQLQEQAQLEANSAGRSTTTGKGGVAVVAGTAVAAANGAFPGASPGASTSVAPSRESTGATTGATTGASTGASTGATTGALAGASATVVGRPAAGPHHTHQRASQRAYQRAQQLQEQHLQPQHQQQPQQHHPQQQRQPQPQQPQQQQQQRRRQSSSSTRNSVPSSPTSRASKPPPPAADSSTLDRENLVVPHQRSRPATPSQPLPALPDLDTPASQRRSEKSRRRPHKSDTSGEPSGSKLDCNRGSTEASSKMLQPKAHCTLRFAAVISDDVQDTNGGQDGLVAATAAAAAPRSPSRVLPARPSLSQSTASTGASSKTASRTAVTIPAPSSKAISSSPSAVGGNTGKGSAADAPPKAPAEAAKPTTPQRLQLRPGVVGLPGRNVRPAAKQRQQAPPQSEQEQPSQAMGNGASKLNHHIKEALHRSRNSGGAASKKGSAPRVATQRPPTPEYQKEEDGKSSGPTIDTLVSPVSPAPSAGSPKPPTAEPAAPTSASAATTPKAASPSVSSIPKPTLPPTPQGLHATSSLQDLINDVRSAASSQPASRRHSPALDGAESTRSQRTVVAEGSHAAASRRRTSSAARSEAAPGPSQRPRRNPAEGDPRMVYSETQGFLYRGRDGTLYPEMVVTREPDPRALYFPRQTDRPIPPGTILAASPLKESHFNCYHNHKSMNRRPNRNHPLCCQTCSKADTEDRWLCSFCSLRICEACMRALAGHQRVLRRLVDELAANTPLNQSSTSRPGSSRPGSSRPGSSVGPQTS